MKESIKTFQMTRRQYMVMRTMDILGGTAALTLAQEAVSSTAIEHPEWDMEERKTFSEWEAEYEGT